MNNSILISTCYLKNVFVKTKKFKFINILYVLLLKFSIDNSLHCLLRSDNFIIFMLHKMCLQFVTSFALIIYIVNFMVYNWCPSGWLLDKILNIYTYWQFFIPPFAYFITFDNYVNQTTCCMLLNNFNKVIEIKKMYSL